jgi:hypothetical protein
MADIDTQLRDYSEWLARNADADAERAAPPGGPAGGMVAVGPEAPRHRTSRLAAAVLAAAAVVVLVVALAVVTRPSPAHAPVSTSSPVSVAPAPSTIESAPSTTAEAPATTVTTATVASTVPAEPTTTVAAVVDATTAPFELPAGDITAAPDDLFVVHADGDLYLHRGALSGGGAEERLVDLADPRAPVAEGPGPNVVDEVAGLIDGALVYGDCCEPVSGNVIAVPSAGAEAVFVGYGHGTTLDPSGTHLASANDYGLLVMDLDTRTASSIAFDQDASAPYASVVDVAWTADGDRVVVLAYDDEGFFLTPFGVRAPFTRLPDVRLDFAPDVEAFRFAEFAGLGPGGEVVVVARPAGSTELRYFDPATLDEDVSRRRSLPVEASSVRLALDGRGLLWVVDGELWYEPAGGSAQRLAIDVDTAWFVRVV